MPSCACLLSGGPCRAQSQDSPEGLTIERPQNLSGSNCQMEIELNLGTAHARGSTGNRPADLSRPAIRLHCNDCATRHRQLLGVTATAKMGQFSLKLERESNVLVRQAVAISVRKKDSSLSVAETVLLLRRVTDPGRSSFAVFL